jgi:hypothetical protein
VRLLVREPVRGRRVLIVLRRLLVKRGVLRPLHELRFIAALRLRRPARLLRLLGLHLHLLQEQELLLLLLLLLLVLQLQLLHLLLLLVQQLLLLRQQRERGEAVGGAGARVYARAEPRGPYRRGAQRLQRGRLHERRQLRRGRVGQLLLLLLLLLLRDEGLRQGRAAHRGHEHLRLREEVRLRGGRKELRLRRVKLRYIELLRLLRVRVLRRRRVVSVRLRRAVASVRRAVLRRAGVHRAPTEALRRRTVAGVWAVAWGAVAELRVAEWRVARVRAAADAAGRGPVASVRPRKAAVRGAVAPAVAPIGAKPAPAVVARPTPTPFGAVARVLRARELDGHRAIAHRAARLALERAQGILGALELDVREASVLVDGLAQRPVGREPVRQLLLGRKRAVRDEEARGGARRRGHLLAGSAESGKRVGALASGHERFECVRPGLNLRVRGSHLRLLSLYSSKMGRRPARWFVPSSW